MIEESNKASKDITHSYRPYHYMEKGDEIIYPKWTNIKATWDQRRNGKDKLILMNPAYGWQAWIIC